jgi:hypothetical protein
VAERVGPATRRPISVPMTVIAVPFRQQSACLQAHQDPDSLGGRHGEAGGDLGHVEHLYPPA